jgi:uncharacterized protein YqgC (DUF456 family)
MPQPLWQDIIRFSRDKYKFASVLIILGIIGLVIPVIPGVILILGAVFLIRPQLYDKFKNFFNIKWKNDD